MNIGFTLRFVTLVALLTVFNHGVFAQIDMTALQDKMSLDGQTKLVRRIELYIQYQQNKDWAKLYDLLYLHEKPDKETFVREQNKSPNNADYLLNDFLQLTAVFPENSTPLWVIIEGCAKIKQNGRNHRYKAFIDAYFLRDNWYFTTVQFVRPIGPYLPEKCDTPGLEK